MQARPQADAAWRAGLRPFQLPTLSLKLLPSSLCPLCITEVREAAAGDTKAQRVVAELARQIEAGAACKQALQLPDGHRHNTDLMA